MEGRDMTMEDYLCTHVYNIHTKSLYIPRAHDDTMYIHNIRDMPFYSSVSQKWRQSMYVLLH